MVSSPSNDFYLRRFCTLSLVPQVFAHQTSHTIHISTHTCRSGEGCRVNSAPVTTCQRTAPIVQLHQGKSNVLVGLYFAFSLHVSLLGVYAFISLSPGQRRSLLGRTPSKVTALQIIRPFSASCTEDMSWCQPQSSISLCFSRTRRPLRLSGNFFCSLAHGILSQSRFSGDVGPKSQHESTGSHAPDSGVTLRGNYNDSADSSIAATMGTETIGTARLSDAGTGPNQPERGMTQHERDDLLLGVGSQFGSLSTSQVGEGSSAGHEHR